MHAAWRLVAFAFITLPIACPVPAQQPSAAPEPAPVTRDALPPSEIYTELLTPFNRVREDMGNWSEVELQAFQQLTAAAKQDCVRIEQTPHEGDEELALAQLCTLARDWDGAYSAARWYTRKSAPPGDQAHLARGFALLTQAGLNLQRRAAALDDLRELNERVPFSAESSAVFRFTVNAMEIVDLQNAVAAAVLQQPHLLEAINTPAGPDLPSAGDLEADAWHTLPLLHQANRTANENAEKTRLLDALSRRTVTPPVADLYRAQQGRNAYEWLGKPAPDFHVLRSTYATPPKPNATRSATLLVFQAEDATDVAALSGGIDSLRRRLPPTQTATLILTRKQQSGGISVATRPSTPSHALFTDGNLFRVFAVEGEPLFLLQDTQGRIAFLGDGNAAWLNPQMQAEMLLSRLPSPTR